MLYKSPSEPGTKQQAGSVYPLAVPPLNVLLHDLKNPLSHIQGTTELLRQLLQERQGDSAQCDEYLEILDLSARRAMLLVQRVQLLDELRHQQVICRLEAQSLDRIAQETARLYRIWAQQRNIKIELVLANVTVKADEGFLTQIIDNLLSNAVKYSLPGGQIRIETRREESNGLLIISDQGPGIPAVEQASLFMPSVASPDSKPAHGLGLAITKQLTELMQGQISCQSDPESGTSFTMILPHSD